MDQPGGRLDGAADYADSAATLCEEMAALFIDGGLPPFAADPAENAIWAQDRGALMATIGSDTPTAWLVRTIPTYLGEAAYQLRAAGALLRARILTGSIGPLIRSITERVGTTAWILTPGVDATERAWRIMLNTLICYAEYRKAAERLGVDTHMAGMLEADHVAIRNDVISWFSPTVGRRNPDDERSWKRGISGRLTYTDLAVYALPSTGPNDPIGDTVRKGLYGAQCGMTHPNAIVSAETIKIASDGRMSFVHQWDHIDKELRVGFHSLSWGYRAWGWYFCRATTMESLMSTIGEISEKLDALVSAEGPEQ